MAEASGSEFSVHTEGTLIIICEGVTSVEHQLRDLQAHVRAYESRLRALDHESAADASDRQGFLQFLICCLSRQRSLDNYHE